MPDATYNLTAMADRLFLEKRLMPLVGKIQRARDLHSIGSDLTMALESLDALIALLETPAAGNDFARTSTESALLNNAVMLYARATKTTSDERGGFDLRPKFNDEELAIHNELTGLRDKAIAHFGSGGSYLGEWQAELVILQFQGDEVRPAVVTRRQIIDRKLVERARRQSQTAMLLTRALSLEKLNEVTDELQKMSEGDPNFHKELTRHPLNLDIFLASKDAGDMARASFNTAYAKGIVR